MEGLGSQHKMEDNGVRRCMEIARLFVHRVWSKWLMSHGDVFCKDSVTMVFMMIKLDGEAINRSFKLKRPRACASPPKIFMKKRNS